MPLTNREIMKVNQLIAKQKYDAALRALESVLKSDPSNHFFRKQKADILHRLGKKRECYSVCSAIVQDYMKAGFFTKALASLKHMKRLLPERNDELTQQERLIVSKIANEQKEKQPKPASPMDLSEGIPIAQASDEDLIVQPGDFEINFEHEDEPELSDALTFSPLFRRFSLEELQALLERLENRSYQPGEIIFTEGEPSTGMLVLVHGSARVYVRTRTGKSQQVRHLSEGAFFGEIGLITGKPRTATITCTESVEVLELNSQALDTLSNSHPEVYDIIIGYVRQRLGSPEEVEARTKE